MNIKENKWLFVKLALLSWFLIGGSAEVLETSADPVPLWIFPIPFFFFVGFLPLFLKASQATTDNINESVWQACPFRFFSDPLPFYHLGAWACLIGGIRTLVDCLLNWGVYDTSVVWFCFSASAGGFVGLWMTRSSIKKAIKDKNESQEL